MTFSFMQLTCTTLTLEVLTAFCSTLGREESLAQVHLLVLRQLSEASLTKTTPLFAVGYLKPPQTHDVLQVKTTPLFAVGYLKPSQTHDVLQVKTTPLFAVGYQKPRQTDSVQQMNTTPLFAVCFLLLLKPSGAPL